MKKPKTCQFSGFKKPKKLKFFKNGLNSHALTAGNRKRTYVEDADQLQRIQPRNDDALDEDDSQSYADAGVCAVLRSVAVHLRRHSEQQDGRLIGHDHRQSRRNDLQSSVGHYELRGSPLSTSRQRMIDSDGQRDDEESD